jgi:hypothetical protein
MTAKREIETPVPTRLSEEWLAQADLAVAREKKDDPYQERQAWKTMERENYRRRQQGER